ncbi:MAG TPA: alpha/beta fold hydrolase [Syntrophales bacterium]|nr:alpha/beta fold hydrolase [Syntrophales bacterium]
MPKNLNERTYSVLDIRAVNRFLFYPRGGEPVPPSTGRQKTLLIPVEENARIGGKCHLRAAHAPNLLFFHGNGEIVSDYDDFAPLFLDPGFNFIPVDYRGYGFSTGSPSVSSMMRDCHAVFGYIKDWLLTAQMSGPLLVMGRSLGSAPALELAAHYPDQIAGLILDSAFAHTGPLLENLGLDPEALGFREEDGFGNLGKIRTFPNPTLIIHGGNDEIIGVDEGRALYEASPSGKKHLVIIPEAGHNDLFMVDPNTYREGLLRMKEALNRE